MMQLSKNKKYQYLFFFIFSVFAIFNGGNSNLLIQINFILIGLLFLYCFKDKNYHTHFKIFYLKNKFSIFFYMLFLLYLIFQILPFPIEYLKLFSSFKYDYITKLSNDISFSPISLSPSNSYFQILNFTSLLILVFILKMIFYTERHKNRLFLFLSLIGFLSALFAIVIYLIENPKFFIFHNSYYANSSTGFFINRTVFAIFLLFCLIASLEILKNLDKKKAIRNQDNFFLKIYVRLFIIFITIGIITSFSRIGNFLLLITVFLYLINEFFFIKSDNKSFRYIILLIIFFDILVLGIYFGSYQLFDRFYFLKDELIGTTSSEVNLNRFEIIKFGLSQLYNFKFFGYGIGSFETLFKINFDNSNYLYANHAHSDVVEYIGEFGLVGFVLLIMSLIKFFFNKINYSFINLILISYLITLLFLDFSLHIPIVQFSFIVFFSLNKKKT
jgi:O-antigen ligase